MESFAPPVEPRDYYTVMVHFYRGELGRIMTWRQRLDVTTNWAVVASTGIITFGLGSERNSHLVFLLANFLCLLLLNIEARRYRYYDAFRARVRMLEAHFIMPVVMRDHAMIQGDWRKILSEDLVSPSFKISRLDAITRRFSRNYVWIFAVIAGAWILKFWLHFPESHVPQELLQSLIALNPVALGLFLVTVAAFYGFLLFLCWRGLTTRTYSGEFLTGAMHRRKWLS